MIGPEAPLVAGVADAVRDRGISCFGPSARPRRARGLQGVRQGRDGRGRRADRAGARVHDADEVAAALDAFGPPYVVKDDGLAAGKGVVVTDDRDAAAAHAAQCDRVVIEEFLDGPEVSLFAITDGSTVYPLQPAQDFKRIFDGDEGPNTGGMGAYTPLPWAPESLVAEVQDQVLQPTVDEMARRGAPFAGLLYAGLALTSRGVRVVEFNARFGDPETQPLMALLDSPLAALLKAAADGNLHEVDPPRWKQGAAVAVVMASAGYPESSSKGDVIVGTETLAARGRRRRDPRRHRRARRRAGHRRRPGAGRHRRRQGRRRRPGQGLRGRSPRSASTARSGAPTSPRVGASSPSERSRHE